MRARQALGVLLTGLLFLGVVAVAGWVVWLNVRHPGELSGPQPTARVSASVSASVIATAVPAPVLNPDPFAGSPAESYADGAAGIVPPPARRVGPYSALSVKRAYALVKKMLVAAYLNPRTLLGGNPAAFARLLIPLQRQFFERHLNRAGRNTRAWVASFAPGSTQFSGSVIKVHGVMSARATQASGRPVLQIRADYLFVYPVQHPYQPISRMRIVERAVIWVDFAQWDDPQGPLEPWWVARAVLPAGGQCGPSDGFIHPAFPGQPERVSPSGKPVNPYDQSVLPSGHGCQASTGT